MVNHVPGKTHHESEHTEGRATVRRLGRFGTPMEEMTPTDVLDAQARAQKLRGITALIFLLVGIAAITGAVTAILGWPWGLLIFGIMSGVIGIALGYERPVKSNDKEGI